MEKTAFARPRYDVVIVGARCAGAATALLLARAGLKVLAIDRQPLGGDTVSTHALMRAGIMQLKRWDILDRLMAEGTPAIRRTTFHYGAEQIPIPIKAEHGVDYLIAPRRTVLDRVLVEAAREAGAEIHHGVSMRELLFDEDDRVRGVVLSDEEDRRHEIAADLVIGADGRQSMVAGAVQAPVLQAGSASSAYAYGYFEGLKDSGYHWYFERRAAAGVIPTNDGRHCIFVGVPRFNYAAAFGRNLESGFERVAAANDPDLAEMIRQARRIGDLRRFIGVPGYLKQCHGPGWALVGDAAYFKDPLTAHGITDALRDAGLLAHAVLRGTQGAFERYQSRRDVLSQPMLETTNRIATFDWNLTELKRLHGRLSEVMKFEAACMARFGEQDNLAA